MAEARNPVSKSKKKATANRAARKPARKTAEKPPALAAPAVGAVKLEPDKGGRDGARDRDRDRDRERRR